MNCYGVQSANQRAATRPQPFKLRTNSAWAGGGTAAGASGAAATRVATHRAMTHRVTSAGTSLCAPQSRPVCFSADELTVSGRKPSPPTTAGGASSARSAAAPVAPPSKPAGSARHGSAGTRTARLYRLLGDRHGSAYAKPIAPAKPKSGDTEAHVPPTVRQGDAGGARPKTASAVTRPPYSARAASLQISKATGRERPHSARTGYVPVRTAAHRSTHGTQWGTQLGVDAMVRRYKQSVVAW